MKMKQVVTVAVNRMYEQQRDKKERLLRPYSVNRLLVWVFCRGLTGIGRF